MPHLRWILLSAGALCVIAAVLCAPAAYRRAKILRAHALIENAARLPDDPATAAGTLQKALLLAPADAPTQRAVARFLTERRNPHALRFWMALVESEAGTTGDHVELVRVAMATGNLELAGEHLPLLMKGSEQETPEILFRAAQWHAAAGRLDDAITCARRAADDNAEGALLLAKLLVATGAPDVASPRLLEISSHPDATGLQALLLLASQPAGTLSAEALQTAIERLENHPLANEDQRLLAWDWRLSAGITTRQALLEQAARAQATASPARRLALARWVNRNGEPEAALQFISGEPLALEVVLLRLDALANLGRWADVDTVVMQTPQLDAVRRSLYGIRAALALGEDDLAASRRRDLFSALRIADAADVLYAAQYADRSGWHEEAVRSYRQLTRLPSGAGEGHRGLIRLAEATGSTREVRDQVRELVESAPGSVEGRNDLDYLNLLLGEPAPIEDIRNRSDKHPALLACRTTLALAHLRNGDAHAASRLYDNVAIVWETAPPGAQAVFAATLSASGDAERGREVASRIDLSRLKPEEIAIIHSLRD